MVYTFFHPLLRDEQEAAVDKTNLTVPKLRGEVAADRCVWLWCLCVLSKACRYNVTYVARFLYLFPSQIDVWDWTDTQMVDTQMADRQTDAGRHRHHTHMQEHVHICTHKCTHTHVCKNTYTCKHIWKNTCTRACTHACIHMHIHTHTHTPVSYTHLTLPTSSYV